MNRLRSFTSLLCLIILCSCSQFSTKEYASADWSFKGKMAIQNETESSSFNIYWLQQADEYQIELSGPLGQGKVTIKGEPGLVVLIKGDDLLYSTSLSSLVAENTTLDLPLDYLQFWVRALPVPGLPYQTEQNESGQTTAILQSGWNVAISSYFDQAVHLPKKLSFVKAEQSGKLVIREWPQAPKPGL
jgi:outer membrane lipoprotein LolB